ncbi:hypothetical protein [Streptomyces sp. NPDC087294]|uniref:hypothetical protein n=1 Tax=Streptomyces sp. NPDC087294 TaxID=3365777 RepID=UPI00382A15D6
MNALTSFPVSMRTRLLAAGVVLVTSLVAGCGSAADRGASGAGESAAVASASRSGASVSPSTSRSAPVTSAPPLTAADGTRYAACADGTCEVAVSRPVDIAVDGGTLSLTKVKPDDSVDFKLTLADGGQASGVMKGNCGATLFFQGGLSGVNTGTCKAGGTPPPPTSRPGALSMQLAGWDADHRAVLRLVSG